MILRRLAGAFRQQDWFTVFLEIMIVVLGVFIGIQVSNWNEAQTDKRLEKQYLQRLYDDVVLTIDDNLSSNEWDIVRAQTQKLVLEALESGVLSEDQRAGFQQGLLYFGFMNTVSLRWATVEELRSTGKMAIIRDIELRELLAQTEASYLYREKQTQSLGERISRYREHIDRKFAPLAYDHTATGAVELVYDFDELAADREIINLLRQIEFNASLVVRNKLRHVDSLTQLKDALGKALGSDLIEAEL